MCHKNPKALHSHPNRLPFQPKDNRREALRQSCSWSTNWQYCCKPVAESPHCCLFPLWRRYSYNQVAGCTHVLPSPTIHELKFPLYQSSLLSCNISTESYVPPLSSYVRVPPPLRVNHELHPASPLPSLRHILLPSDGEDKQKSAGRPVPHPKPPAQDRTYHKGKAPSIRAKPSPHPNKAFLRLHSPESSQYDEWYYVLSKENYNARNSNKHDSEYCLPQ